MDDMDFDLSGSDSECERNEGFWSESHGELSDNIVALQEMIATPAAKLPYDHHQRNEGFWSESDGGLSDNVVAGGEVQAAGNEIRPQQFEPEAGQAEENGDEIPDVHYDREDIDGRLAITTGQTKSYS